MKLKYKKIILLTTLSVMGIGLLTLSVSNDKTQAKESVSNSTVQETAASTDQSQVTVSPAVTAAPTPTVLPVYNIEEDAYPKISKLFKDFYAAKNNRDVDAIKKLLSDPTQVESQDDLQKKTEYIEEYKNIKTYTKKGFEDGTYIVYVYHEIKFTGINTPAPGLSKFYVITGTDGNLKIYSDEMDTTTKAYYKKRNKDDDVIALIDMTNKKSKKAIKKDEDLKNFWENIDKLTKKDASKAQGDSVE